MSSPDFLISSSPCPAAGMSHRHRSWTCTHTVHPFPTLLALLSPVLGEGTNTASLLTREPRVIVDTPLSSPTRLPSATLHHFPPFPMVTSHPSYHHVLSDHPFRLLHCLTPNSDPVPSVLFPIAKGSLQNANLNMSIPPILTDLHQLKSSDFLWPIE